MSEVTSYTFTVLRYVHDVATGEFLNVGVLLYAPERGYLRAKTRTTQTRLTHFFPGADGLSFKRTMAQIDRAVSDAAQRLEDLFTEKDLTAGDLAARVLPNDDSSLQWSPVGAGRTKEPHRELERLFERMVSRYDKQTQERRTEEDVWKEFNRALQQRQLLNRFQPKEIASDVDKVLFKHAWKNGYWHCLEPISFDLVDGEAIHQKALRWLGQGVALKDARERFKVYFLIGEPKTTGVQSHFGTALKILEKMPVPVKLYTEAQVEEFTNDLASEMTEHDHRLSST